MNKLLLIAAGIAVAVFIVSPSFVSAEVYGTTKCTYFNQFPIGSGYSCNENNQTYRTFHNPGAYDAMVAYYAPAEPVTPLYTFVNSAPTESLSGP